MLSRIKGSRLFPSPHSINLIQRLAPLKSWGYVPGATGTTCSLPVVPVWVRYGGRNSPLIMSDWTNLGHMLTSAPITGERTSDWFKPNSWTNPLQRGRDHHDWLRLFRTWEEITVPCVGEWGHLLSSTEKERAMAATTTSQFVHQVTTYSFAVCALSKALCWSKWGLLCSPSWAPGTELGLPRSRGIHLQTQSKSPYVHQTIYPQG